MPVLTATGAGVRHRRRWLFRDLDVTVEPGEVVAVVGPPGSGRTTVLLALAKRFRLTAGKIQIAGTAALGQVPDVSQPEPVFSVAEHVRERLALLGLGRPVRSSDEVPLLGLDPEAKGWQLSPYERQLLGLVLAQLEDPQVIALDGVDDGLDAAERGELWRILREIAMSGVAVLVTAREVDESSGVTLIRLGGMAGGLAFGSAGSADGAGPDGGMQSAEADGVQSADGANADRGAEAGRGTQPADRAGSSGGTQIDDGGGPGHGVGPDGGVRPPDAAPPDDSTPSTRGGVSALPSGGGIDAAAHPAETEAADVADRAADDGDDARDDDVAGPPERDRDERDGEAS